MRERERDESVNGDSLKESEERERESERGDEGSRHGGWMTVESVPWGTLI